VNKEALNNENTKIQALLDGYLRFRSAAAQTRSEAGDHLDEDALAAFVDGDLTRRENESFIAHLVDCSFCLHKTAELSQLRSAFEEESLDLVIDAAQPAKISEVLGNLFARLFGSGDGVVFAHEEKKEPEEKEEAEKGSSSPDDEAKS